MARQHSTKGTTTTIGDAFATAMHAYEQGRTGEARRLAKRLCETAPRFGGGHYLMGLLAIDQGHGKRAVASLARAIAITPGQAVLHLAMGRALELSGDSAEAALHYRTVLTIHGDHAEAHARLGALQAKIGKRDEAIDHCRAAIAANPIHAEAMNTLGALLTDIGQAEEACAVLRRVVELRPDWAAAINNLGVALRETGRHQIAADALEAAIDLRPDHAPSRANLASVYRALGRLDDARSHAEHATQLDPRLGDGWMELGLSRQEQGHWEGAAAAFERAVALIPDQAKVWYCLGEACRTLGEAERAARAYGKALEIDPADIHGAGLGLALAGGAPIPGKAPEAYVRQLFDDYAGHFDAALVDNLEYRAPQILEDALRRCLGPVSGLDVLDAGCGTGLAAPVLRPLATRLEGVDLSPAMIDKARERGLYDSLEVGELAAAMTARPSQFDLVVAADVLVYLGDLAPVMAAAHSALRPRGTFAFTVERTEDSSSYLLGAKQRYAHSPDYIRRQAETAGFQVLLLEQAVTRRDGGQDVPGLVAVLRAA